MRSESYRYYFLDGAGHLSSGEWLDAESDEDAVTQVECMHPDGRSEVWRGTRLVAILTPTRRLSA